MASRPGVHCNCCKPIQEQPLWYISEASWLSLETSGKWELIQSLLYPAFTSGLSTLTPNDYHKISVLSPSFISPPSYRPTRLATKHSYNPFGYKHANMAKIVVLCQSIFCLQTKKTLTELYKPRADNHNFMVLFLIDRKFYFPVSLK